MPIDIRPAADRFHTRTDWLDSRHSFSFGPHRDPANTHHGLVLVNNDDRVAPGAGFPSHPHRDMEIVTWVVEGALEHRDSTGTRGVIVPGLAQRMSAGRGIVHSEQNASDTEPVHFVQMWVRPDVTGIEPSYEQRDVGSRLADGGLVAVASGQGHEGAVSLHQADAVLWAARLAAGDTVTVPTSPHAHLFVTNGRVVIDADPEGIRDHHLDAGDAARLTDAHPLDITALEPSEVLVWETA